MNRIRVNILLLLLCIFIPGVAQNVSDGWNKNRTARLTKPVFVYNNWSAANSTTTAPNWRNWTA